MLRLFIHYIPYAVLFLGILDFMLILAAGEAAWVIRAAEIDMHVDEIWNRALPLSTFAVTTMAAMIAVGV